MAVGVGDRKYAVGHEERELPITFVHIAVVMCAQRHEIVHVGRAVVSPVGNVMWLTLCDRHFAIGNCAVCIHGFNRLALVARG